MYVLYFIGATEKYLFKRENIINIEIIEGVVAQKQMDWKKIMNSWHTNIHYTDSKSPFPQY